MFIDKVVVSILCHLYAYLKSPREHTCKVITRGPSKLRFQVSNSSIVEVKRLVWQTVAAAFGLAMHCPIQSDHPPGLQQDNIATVGAQSAAEDPLMIIFLIHTKFNGRHLES